MLRAARRAYAEHERVLELDPSRKDAGLIVGMYRYAISSLSLPSRLIARSPDSVATGSADSGWSKRPPAIQAKCRRTRSSRSSSSTTARRDIDDALRVIAELQRQYPRNRLLWLEAGSTALRAGRPALARAALEHGLEMLAADPRPRAFGEEARWGYYHGAALVALKETGAARERSTPRSSDPSRPGCTVAFIPSSGSSPTLQAIGRTRSTNIGRPSVCADRDDDDACVERGQGSHEGRYR